MIPELESLFTGLTEVISRRLTRFWEPERPHPTYLFSHENREFTEELLVALQKEFPSTLFLIEERGVEIFESYREYAIKTSYKEIGGDTT